MLKQRRQRQVALLIFVGIITIGLAYHLRAIVNPLIVSLLIAYMLNPIIAFSEKHNINRFVAIMAIYGVFFAGLLAFSFFGIPEIYSQSKQFIFAVVGESSTDTNQNGKWDSGEPFKDENNNGIRDFQEDYTDLNKNGYYDPPEKYTDINEDNQAQPEELFYDKNNNKEWEKGYVALILEKSKTYLSKISKRILTQKMNQRRAEIDKIEALLKSKDTPETEKTKLQKELSETKLQLQRLEKEASQKEDYSKQLIYEVQKQLESHQEELASHGLTLLRFSLASVFAGLESILIFISYLVLMPIYVFFFLQGMDTIWERFVTHLPGKQRASIVNILLQIHDSVSSFFHGRIIIFIIVSFITTVGLILIGIEFALLLGLITGLGIMIPFLSLIIGFLPALAILYFTKDASTAQFVWLCVLFAFAMGITQFVLEPLILGKKVNIHPVTILLSFMIGGKLFGFFGVLCAVPMASIVKILMLNLVVPSLKEIAEEGNEMSLPANIENAE